MSQWMRKRLASALSRADIHSVGWVDRAIDGVLAELREPDRPMLIAMMEELGTEDHRPLGPMWRAAIDAASNSVA